MAKVSSMVLYGVIRGARMVAKRMIPHPVSGTFCLTVCAVDSGGRGLGGTASAGPGFVGKVS